MPNSEKYLFFSDACIPNSNSFLTVSLNLSSVKIFIYIPFYIAKYFYISNVIF